VKTLSKIEEGFFISKTIRDKKAKHSPCTFRIQALNLITILPIEDLDNYKRKAKYYSVYYRLIIRSNTLLIQ
jgi:hypothetical protein